MVDNVDLFNFMDDEDAPTYLEKVKNYDYHGGKNLNVSVVRTNFKEMINNFSSVTFVVAAMVKESDSENEGNINYAWFDIRITNQNGEILEIHERAIEFKPNDRYRKKSCFVNYDDNEKFKLKDHFIELVARSDNDWEMHVNYARILFIEKTD